MRLFFFDVGAHVGYFSLLACAAAPAGSVHSFEPDENNYAFCNQIKTLNNLPNWTINQVGVGLETTTLFFQVGLSSSTGHVADEGGVPVTIVSIDDYVETHQLTRLDLIKIDVEGFGCHVLKGAAQTLKRLKPTLIMELHSGTEETAVLASIIGNDFSCYTVRGNLIADLLAEKPDHVVVRPV